MDFIADEHRDVNEFLENRMVRELLSDPLCSLRLLTPAGNYLYVSEGVESLLGYPAHEFVRMNAFDVLHPGDLAVANEARKGLQDGPVEMVVRAIHKDGRPRWVSTRMMMTRGLISVAVIPTTKPPGGAIWAPAPPFV